jgi:FKBP-type peptidyl-prolyl cis-trans isomerase
MRIVSTLCAGLVGGLTLLTPAVAIAAPSLQPAVSGPQGETGYCIGFDLGRQVRANLKDDGVNADTDAVLKGFTDAIKGVQPSMTEAQMAKILAEVQKTVDEQKAKKKLETDPVYRAAAEDAAKRSGAFLKGFAARAGVKPLPSGVLYSVVRSGDGAAVGNAAAAVVNYQAFLTNGTQIANGQGVTVTIDRLVPGAQETLRNMKVGDRWYVAIPPEHAFAGRGLGADIGPHEAIVVDVEVLEVKP